MPKRLGKRAPDPVKYTQGINTPPDWKVMILHKKGMTTGQIVKELGTTSTYIEETVTRLNNPKGKTFSQPNELLKKKRLPIKNITPWSGGKVQYLPCPICQKMNPVSKSNLRMKCSQCGTNLLSVRIKRKVKK